MWEFSNRNSQRSATDLLIPPVRAYVRYAPFALGKRVLWSRLIDSHLAWRPYHFEARTRFGSRFSGQTQDIVQQYIYYFGMWEPNLTAWIRRRLRSGDTFVDVGANIGYYTLLAGQLVGPTGKVVAIEAAPSAFRALEENVARNQARNVRSSNVACWDSEGTLHLYAEGATDSHLTSVLPQAGRTFEGEVPARPLTAILSSDEIRSARLVKIDIEGAEGPAVAGMIPLLTEGRPDLEVMVEVDPDRMPAEGPGVNEVLRIFKDAGFYPYRVQNDYEAVAYIQPRIEPPRRLEGPVEAETDIIFSRVEAETL